MILGGSGLSVCFKFHAEVLNRGIFDEGLKCWSLALVLEAILTHRLLFPVKQSSFCSLTSMPLSRTLLHHLVLWFPEGWRSCMQSRFFMLPCIKTHSTNFIGNVNSFVCFSILDFNFSLDSYRWVSELRTEHGGCKSSVVIFVAVLRWHYLATRAAFVSMSVSLLSCSNSQCGSAELWSGQVWKINLENL